MSTLATVNDEKFALGLALSAFDAAATWLWLTLNIATEANPVVQALIDPQGLEAAMGIRAGLGVIWFAGFRLLASRSKLAGWANLGATVLLGALALSHLAIAGFATML